MRAVVAGMVATYPVGGVAWDYLQYAVGLERLGFEVVYLEDTGTPMYDPETGLWGATGAPGVRALRETLAELSPALAERWHVRSPDGETHGLAPDDLAEAMATADVFLNVSGGTLLRDAYMACPRKVLVDTDPGWNHFVNYPRWDANPGWLSTHGFRGHDAFFTYAQAIGSPGCDLPLLGLPWMVLTPPVVLDLWGPEPPGLTYTTVMTWDNFRRPIEHEGRTYGTKELEFERIEALPGRVGARLELAVGGSNAPAEHWRELGWSVVSADDVAGSWAAYRRYVQGSRAELTVAKNVYAATGSGWISVREACYLAAGRPVILQETGFSRFLPAGEGLLAFTDLEEAAAAIDAVESDYARHADAAVDFARAHLDASVVLGDLLERVGVA